MADLEESIATDVGDKKRRKSSKKKSIGNIEPLPEDTEAAISPPKTHESSRNSINEIVEATEERKISFDEPYKVPKEVKPHDIEALKEIDERKLVELKEAFKIFDFGNDGVIDAADLRAMFISLGQEISEDLIEEMMSEAISPLDFDSFVVLLGYRTIDLDPEEVLLEALNKWDKDGNGLISEELLRHDLMSFGDKFTGKEVDLALEEAPIAKGTGTGFNCKGPVMIDYPTFCKSLCGLRKRVKK